MREAFEAFEAQQEEAADTKTAEVNPLTHWGTGRRSRARVAGIGLLVVLLIVAGYVLFDSVGGNREPDGEGGLETPPPRSTAAFSIDTDPPGASVYLSGRLIGVTPLEDTVEGDSAQLRIQKSGYVPLDTAFGVGSEKQVDLSVQLTEEASQTALSVSTVPTGASVHLNGERIGTTPLDYAVEGSAARVRVQKEGYVPVDTVAQLNDGQRAQMDLQLSEVETDATPPPRGSIDLRASPAGTITVDGQRYDESTAVQLPVGPHQVRFEHPEHGTIDTTITVKDEQTQVLTCYFEQTIQVRSPERQGSVYLSGKNLEASTPHDLSRGPGTYGVGLRIANQGPHTIPGGVYRKMVDGREVERVEFSGDAKEITIGPSFVPETHVVTFRVRSLLERVRGEIERLPQELKQAIEEQEWGGLPAPLAAYYPDKLETFYAKHEVRKANVVVEDERIDGETVVLPVTVYVEYQQKGRGGIKHVPLPANWIWKMGDGDVRLLRIQSR